MQVCFYANISAFTGLGIQYSHSTLWWEMVDWIKWHCCREPVGVERRHHIARWCHV